MLDAQTRQPRNLTVDGVTITSLSPGPFCNRGRLSHCSLRRKSGSNGRGGCCASRAGAGRAMRAA
jgi:hypothetical protein